MSLDLFIVRAGVYPDRYLGYLVPVPPVPSPEEAQGMVKGDGEVGPALEDALFGDLLAGIGKPRRLVPHGFVEPTAWERRFVAWVASRTGLEPEPGWDRLPEAGANPAFAALATALADPLAPAPARSSAVVLLECEDPELEAHAAARQLRAWLAPQPFEDWPAALDQVLVLLPSSPDRRATWKRVLERHGLAASTSGYVPLATRPLGRWLVALARVARWRREPVHRDRLRATLLGPFVSMPQGTRRSDLRDCLRSLRVHDVPLALWQDHLAQWKESQREQLEARDVGTEERAELLLGLGRRHQGLSELTELLAERLAWGETLFRGLQSLLDDLGVAARVRASGVDQAVRELEVVRSLLRRLAEAEQLHPRAPITEKLRDLEQRLEELPIRTGAPVAHGVRVVSYAQYDGSRPRLLVLAGLEEGGHPRAPARPSRAEAELARRLGLGTREEDLLRQARVAAAAAARAREQVLLSYSRTDEAGADTFPGPLLAAVRSRKGHPGLEPARFSQAESAPASAAAVQSPADVRATSLRAVGEALLAGPLRDAWERARATAEHAGLLDQARAPTAATGIGPYAGKIGVPLAPRRFSPTALEVLGQCASRYYLERLLGVEETGDEGVDLDALETGSMLHEALAIAAQAAIAKDDAWVLNADLGERNAHVEKLRRRVAVELEAVAKRYLASHPSLCEALVNRVVARWTRVLHAWLAKEAARPRGGLFPGAGEPDPAALGEQELAEIAAGAPKVKEALAAVGKVDLDAALALLDSVRETPADSQADARRRFQGAGLGKAFAQKAFIEAATVKAKAARAKQLDGLAAEVRNELAAARASLSAAVLEAWRKDRLEVPPRVVASEWSFGDKIPEGADPRSTEEPLVVELTAGRTMEVRGRVDRVDAAEGRPDAAVADYKSGRDRSQSELVRELGEGRHLQLPLYGMAVEQLLARMLETPLHVVRGRLDFLRTRKQPGIVLEAGFQPPLVEVGKTEAGPVALDQVVKLHLAHCLDRLESGLVPLLPRSCPSEDRKARCPCSVVCDFRPEARAQFAVADTQPRFVSLGKERAERPPGGEEAAPELVYEEAEPVEDPGSGPEAREAHEKGQERARDVRRDVVLSAGAGSGKTRALVDRYRTALVPGCGPENVLCITFTRKATAEMRSRIRDRLLEDSGQVDDPVAMRAWLTALGTAPIQTIDAFAARVVKELTDEDVTVSDAAGGFAQEFAAERLRRDAARPSPELALLLEELPIPRLREALADLLDAPALPTTKLSAKAIRQGWEDEAERLGGDLRARLEELVRRVRQAVESDESAAATLEEGLGGTAAALEAFESQGFIAGLWALSGVRVGTKGPRKPQDDAAALKQEMKAMKGEAGDGRFKSAAGVLGDCKTPRDVRVHLDREAGIAAAALEVARSWLEDFTAARLARGFASFDDVLARATRALKEAAPEEVLARLPFRHLLVDEFQDTSDAQVRFVLLLQARLEEAGRRPSLFVVGDPKQSIYRFRGAEVDQFEEFLQQAPRASRAALTVCWRAEPELSRSLSRLFARVFDRRLDPEAAVPWEPLASRATPGKEPRIELLLPDGLAAPPPPLELDAEPAPAGDDHAAPEEDADPGLEQALVRRVKELLREPASGDGESPIAILTQGWERAIHYGNLLREHGVSAFVQGGRGLLAVREVRELFLWLQALAREDDDLVFVALLRSATVGLSDPGLYALRQGHGLELRDYTAPDQLAPARPRTALSTLRQGFRFDAGRAIAALEQAAGRSLEADVSAALRRDEERLRRFGETWHAAARSFGLVPLADTLERVVESTGHEATVRSRPNGLEGLANLRSFLELVRAVEPGLTPADAVRELERVSGAGDDPAAAGFSLEPGVAVTITVVHQAKGREWDTVIVPDLQRTVVRPHGRVGLCGLQRLVRFDGKTWQRHHLPSSLLESTEDLFATTGGVGAKVLTAAISGAERAESRRLLYVACTRARKRLVLTATWPDDEALERYAKKGTLRLRRSHGWLEDVVFALQLRPGKGPTLVPGDGVWKEGRDFRWVKPEGEGYGAEPATAALDAEVDPAAVHLAACSVEPVPLVVVNPSSAEGSGPVPAPTLAAPAVAPPVRGESPFAGANEEGSAFHRTVQLWSYRGECSDVLVRKAVREVVGEWRLEERVARIRQLLDAQATCQPGLLAELREASMRGELFHELSIGYLRPDGARVEGVIDLLFRDAGGSWHLVDYKTDRATDEDELRKRFEKYHGQVRAYADALAGQLPGGVRVESMRLWLVGAGVVARWG